MLFDLRLNILMCILNFILLQKLGIQKCIVFQLLLSGKTQKSIKILPEAP